MATKPQALPADPQPVIIAQDPPAVVADPAAVATPAVVEPVVAQEPDDEFTRMFDKFSQPVDPTKPEEPVVAVPPVVVAKVPAPGETPPAEPVPPPAQVVVPDPIERLADILTQRQQQPQPQPHQPQQQPVALPQFTTEETAALQTFYQEWPEVAHAQELALRMAVQQTTDYVFRSMASYLGPKLKLLDDLASNVQWDQLERRIPGYATLEDKLAGWVDSQPDYLKAAYESVMSGGTADQVESMVQRYRVETGDQEPAAGIAPQPTVPGVKPPPTRPAELSPAARQAAAALAPVNGKRSTPTQGEPVGFDEAFDRYAKEAALASR